MRMLNDRILLAKRPIKTVSEESSMEWDMDNEHLIRAEVISVSEELANNKDKVNVPEVGDFVYYVEPREKGKIKFNGEDHYAIPFGSLVSII